ncbi:MAG: hypothetical protein HWD59_04585 [Coxiellaceae bacterium]|nr:MAG: hypothetical protein HWD59_04585 [Coxiellaceae bacterium]
MDTPLALLQPYGGPTSDGKAQGMHFPLRPNTQVGVIFRPHLKPTRHCWRDSLSRPTEHRDY